MGTLGTEWRQRPNVKIWPSHEIMLQLKTYVEDTRVVWSSSRCRHRSEQEGQGEYGAHHRG